MMDCGCVVKNGYTQACQRHWNETGIRHELDRIEHHIARGHGKLLNPDNPDDKRCLDFLDQVAYWAARGVGDRGSA